MAKEYSVLGSREGQVYILTIAFIIPIFMAMALFILYSFTKKSNRKRFELNPYRKKALVLSICAVTLFIFVWGHCVLIGNDLFFFAIDIRNLTVSVVNCALISIYYFSAKAALYYALTYYHQSLLYEYDNNSKMSKCLIVWMVIAAMIWTIIGAIYIIDDAMEETSKEVGFVKDRNIYLSFYTGHDGAPFAAVSVGSVVLFDFVYFAVLIGLSVSAMKKMKKNETMNANQLQTINEKSLKAFTMIVFTCLALWINAIAYAVKSDIKWITSAIEIASDCICLYFIFIESSLYGMFFGIFHDCFGKCLYGSQYKRITNKSEYNPINIEETDALQDNI